MKKYMNYNKIMYLTEIATSDGLVHQGIVFVPQKHGKKAILWIHGLTGKFYGDVSMMQSLAMAGETYGFGVASFNTRGHDMLASAKKNGAYATIGAGNELFEECVLDISASNEFLVGQGFSEIILAGNSTGANKACYYAATQNDPRVIGVILLGPLSDRYGAQSKNKNYELHMAFMQQKIAEGKGEEILVGYEFFPLTPNRWMSLYTKGSNEDVFNYWDGEDALVSFGKIQIPLMVMIGGNDEHADRPVSEIQASFDTHANAKKYSSIVVPDANHGFDGKEKEVVESISQWIDTL
jgi:pimeloyl-ACP methyl ester carboxylesterase